MSLGGGAAQADVDADSIVSSFVIDAAFDGGSWVEYGAGALYAVRVPFEEEEGTIVRYSSNGSTSTVVAGGGNSTADGIPATSARIVPGDFTIAPDGTVYFIDNALNVVRRVAVNGIVTTVAGNGTTAASGDGGPARSAGMSPTAIAIDAAGNLLIADGPSSVSTPPDEGNQRLRKVTPNGTITTLASFDLPGPSWNPRNPYAIDIDGFGNAYVGVYFSMTFAGDILKVAPNGSFTSYYGTDTDGPGTFPGTFAVTQGGKIYTAETRNSGTQGRIAVVPAPGQDTVLNETTFFPGVDVMPSQVDGPLRDAFMLPGSITASPSGDLYVVAPAPEFRIRKITNPAPDPAIQTVQPTRILDTRPATQTGYTGDKPGPGSVVTLDVAGRGGVPAAGAASVTLSMVITDATNAGYVTVWPSGVPMPLASSLNAQAPGETVANLVTIPIGADGKVSIFTEAGGHLIADVAGWSPPGTYVPMTPTRLLDTRQPSYGAPKPAAGDVVDLAVAGVAGVPTERVSAVTLNVTAAEATAAGFITVWPKGVGQPNASSLNLDAGGTAPNQVTIPLGAGGAISMFTEQGAHLIVDIVGYYTESSGFTPLVPSRVMDTRPGVVQLGYSGDKPAAGAIVPVQIAGRGGVPANGAGAVILNITATDATAPGFISAWPGGTTQPNASILNLAHTGQTRPNAVVIPLGSDGTINLFTEVGTHLIVDVTGWFPI